MRNRQTEVVIVPAIGRIMQFRFIDQPDGPFWENAGMYGVQPSSASWNTPGSFGGDKVWPSPQTWPWPPPHGFDSMNFTAGITNGVVTLTGPVDAIFGTRVVRRITLHPTEPILRVSNTFEKLSGDASRIGVWVITQVKEGERIFMPVPKNSVFPTGYTALGPVPSGLVVTNGLVSLSRDPNAPTKIGNDAGALLWVGANSLLLIESPRRSGVTKTGYPDGGCSAEIYTNPDSGSLSLKWNCSRRWQTWKPATLRKRPSSIRCSGEPNPPRCRKQGRFLRPDNSHPAVFSRALSAAQNPFASTRNSQPG